MFCLLCSCLLSSSLLAISNSVPLQERLPRRLVPYQRWELGGGIEQSSDLSALARCGSFWVIGSDEGAALQVLESRGPTVLGVTGRIELGDPKSEVDVEAIAVDGSRVFALGSHCRNRKKVDLDKKTEKNRERIRDVQHEESRDALYSFHLDERGALQGALERISLRPMFQADPLFRPFLELPSKENGLDLEGLAVRNGRWYVGMRGPVLRGNLATVMVVNPKSPGTGEALHLDLGGYGVRDLIPAAEGFLILAGPVGDSHLPARLYRWNGMDGTPGRDQRSDVVRCLGEFPSREDGSPESIVLLLEEKSRGRVLTVHDGVAGGDPMVFQWIEPEVEPDRTPAARERAMALAYDAFDQDPLGGWRTIAAAGFHQDAVQWIEEYVLLHDELNEAQRRVLRWHSGQLLATSGATDQARLRFEHCENPDEPEDSPVRWNAYVRATLAFLRGDEATLRTAREEIAAGAEWEGRIPNLDVVDRLLARIGQPYAYAYDGS